MKALFNFGEAINLAKEGQPVSAIGWDLIDRVTGIDEVKYVPAEQIWSPENRRMGKLLKGPEGLIPVQPYCTKFTRNGIENYIPTNMDMNSHWMLSSTSQRCYLMMFIEGDEGLGEFLIHTNLISAKEHLTQNMPFWMLYEQEMIGYHHNAIFIAGSRDANLVNATIFNKLSALANERTPALCGDSFVADLNFLNDDWKDCCTVDQENYLTIQLDELDFDFDHLITNVDEPVNVFVDIDSLNELNLRNGENAVEYVKAQCVILNEKFPLLNWVAFSLKEEIGNSSVGTEAADDETYALKAD